MKSWIGPPGPPTMGSLDRGTPARPAFGKSTMAERTKEYELSLLQKDPAREAKLARMRGKLATFVPPAPETGSRPRSPVSRAVIGKWALRVAMVALIAAINWLLIDRKDVLLAKMGYEGVPALPKPSGNLTLDERALYYAYALYDIAKFRQRFGLTGFYAIDQSIAKKKLEDLLPLVSAATVSEISGYAPVGFHKRAPGGRP